MFGRNRFRLVGKKKGRYTLSIYSYQLIPDLKKRNFSLLTIKTYFLARTKKRFILTGNVGRLFTIIIIVSVIVIFIVIVIVNVIVIAVIVIDIVIVHKCID